MKILVILIIVLTSCAFMKSNNSQFKESTECDIELKKLVTKLKGSWKYEYSYTKDTSYVLDISDFRTIGLPNYLKFELSNDVVELKDKETTLPNLFERRKDDVFCNTKCTLSFESDKFVSYPISPYTDSVSGKISQVAVTHQYLQSGGAPYKAFYYISSVCSDSLIILQKNLSSKSWGTNQKSSKHLFIRSKE